jgi:hypothetical protein
MTNNGLYVHTKYSPTLLRQTSTCNGQPYCWDEKTLSYPTARCRRYMLIEETHHIRRRKTFKILSLHNIFQTCRPLAVKKTCMSVSQLDCHYIYTIPYADFQYFEHSVADWVQLPSLWGTDTLPSIISHKHLCFCDLYIFHLNTSFSYVEFGVSFTSGAKNSFKQKRRILLSISKVSSLTELLLSFCKDHII